jgi:TonB family protein
VLITLTSYAETPPRWTRYPSPRRGIIICRVDSASGRVAKVIIAKSTGDRKLDSYAIKAFERARFKPGTVPSVMIPIAFTKDGLVTEAFHRR